MSFTPLSLSEVHRRRAARTLLPFSVESATPDVAYATKSDEDEEVTA